MFKLFVFKIITSWNVLGAGKKENAKMKDILLVTVWVVYCITAHQFIISNVKVDYQSKKLVNNLNIVAVKQG